MSTLEVFWSEASPPLSADLRVGGLVISGDDVGGTNVSKDVLLKNANNGQRILVYGPAGTGVSTLAFLSDIPVIPPTVSSFQTASVSSLSASSINGGIPYTTANPPPLQPVVSSFETASVSSATISSINSGIPYTTANPPPLQPVVSSFQTASVSSATISSINGGIPYTTAFPPSQTDSFSTINVSSINSQNNSTINIFNGPGGNLASLTFNPAGDITGIATNYITLQAQGPGVLVGATYNGGAAGNSSNYATNRYDIAASSIFMSTNLASVRNLSTSAIGTSSITFNGVSTITLNTAAAAGSAAQPIGRLQMAGCDLDLGQNDLWAQQIRLGAANPGGSAQTEVIWYSPDNLTTRGLGLGGQDLTIRIQSTINSGANNGYLLDTTINRPFFSTINAGTSTALCAVYPSTSLSSFGVSTLSVIPPLTYIASVYDSTTQLVAGANTATNTQWNTTSLNLGGFTVGTSTIAVPVAGVYEITASYQFATTSGGANLAQFWLLKNGTAVPQTNSRVTVANNADNLGTISIFDTAAAGDAYGFQFYSADANMAATAVAAGATPAIPSIIVNAKRIG